MNETNDWNECEPGELRSLVRDIRHERRQPKKRTVISLALLGAGLIFLAVVGGQLGSRNDRPESISCTKVQLNLERYASGQLDSDLRVRIRDHLENCAHCSEEFERVVLEREAVAFSQPVLRWLADS